MLLVFEEVFSIPVSSWIVSIGDRVGGGGGWRAGGGVNQPFGHKHQCCAISRAKPVVRNSLAPHAVPLKLLRGHTGHEIHPCGLKADLTIYSQMFGVSG